MLRSAIVGVERGGESLNDELRQHNREALQDFLDGILPDLHPGSPDPEQPYDDSAKGESRVLLKASQYKRVEDGEGLPGEEETYKLLDQAMVSPTGWLARTYPTEHSALVQFVFGASAGYQALLELETAATKGAPLAKEPAIYCRRGLQRVLDYLDGSGHQLVVPHVPASKVREQQRSESRQDRARATFERHYREQPTATKAIRRTMEETGYGERQLWTLTEDLR